MLVTAARSAFHLLCIKKKKKKLLHSWWFARMSPLICYFWKKTICWYYIPSAMNWLGATSPIEYRSTRIIASQSYTSKFREVSSIGEIVAFSFCLVSHCTLSNHQNLVNSVTWLKRVLIYWTEQVGGNMSLPLAWKSLYGRDSMTVCKNTWDLLYLSLKSSNFRAALNFPATVSSMAVHYYTSDSNVKYSKNILWMGFREHHVKIPRDITVPLLYQSLKKGKLTRK